MLTLVTVCAADEAAEALVLARSFLAVHPEGRVSIVLADAIEAPTTTGDRITFRTGRELAEGDFDLQRAALDPPRLARALAPRALKDAGVPALGLVARAEVLAPVALPQHDGLLLLATGDEAAGVVDTGAVAVLGPRADEALDWWAGRAAAFDVDDVLDAALTRFDDVELAREPGWAVAPWNAELRGVRDRAGTLVIEDEPVTWVRFDDAEPGPLAAAQQAHAERVAAAAAELGPVDAEAATLPDGTPLDARLRRQLIAAFQAGAVADSPFTERGMLAFRTWLDAPEPTPAAGGVSRYLYDVWSSREDLRNVYRDLGDDADRRGFLGWVVAHGVSEMAVPGWLLPEAPVPPPPELAAPTTLGVNLAGYFQSELGVGEAARRVTAALDAAQIPLLPVQTRALPPTRRGHPYEVTSPSVAPFGTNLVCVNADGLPGFAEEVGEEFFADRYTIGMWWWELPTFAAGDAAFAHVDELWVGSSWVQEAIAPASPVPVLKVPVAVVPPRVSVRSRTELGLPEGFLVLFFFDHNSVLERKNPIGLIDAFAKAFAPGEASLVIKSINGELHPRDRFKLKLAAGRHPDVHLVERHVETAERDAMLASCDLYASLHRSEGFGLTLAETMALGRPVLATEWSGNLEFMHPDTTWLVPAELVPVGDGNAPYDALSHWADPDLDAAAAAMRAVFEDPAGAAAKAAAAAVRLKADHAPERVGEVMRARLEVLEPLVAERRAAGGRSRVRVAPVDAALAVVEQRAAQGADAFAAVHTDPVRRGMRSGVLKASRPLTENQRAVDRAMIGATREIADVLDARIAAEVDAHAELTATTLAGQRRLEARVLTLTAEVERLAASATEATYRAAQAEAAAAALDWEVRPLIRGAEAVPWTQGEPFTRLDHPVAGRVLALGEASGEEQTTSYRSFEDVFRGSRERVLELLATYPVLLAGHGPVLDVGAGRGELLELLRDAGIEARGVDLDEGMAAGAEGLDIAVGDGVEHLEELPEGELGAVTAIHVIEHLPLAVLERFLRAARRALRPGGLLVCETVNPHAAFALKTFWVDPSHQHPLFPETVLVLARAAGFGEAFFAHLRGSGDVDADRYNEDSYTLVAEVS